ncbi:alternate F1F0 ATPase, F1 subunit alpha [Ferruginivarius sediminum]|uniref:ATP synthase subunit alpha n=1 Tax=Ferruginivarius sediminum TaxID=2661937 RepID=A0A369TAE7_9PROT|nr:alternate F1F0 ATPase, F1 subunit alpha [Ferruginivarius sediminum]RDD62248.1 alternate F1F0 ATPase, F1 subunit alpha [Ferruginivarius sediminum]
MAGILDKAGKESLDAAKAARKGLWRAPQAVETGTVVHVTSGIARVRGLDRAQSEEVLRFPGGLTGMVSGLDSDELGVVLLGDSGHLCAGDTVRRTGRVIDVPVGNALLGRVVDAVGRPLDEGGPLHALERRAIEQEAARILDRAPVSVPLKTGLKAIDALIPVGRGQRELILGDRQTGKTAIAVDTIINQRDTEVVAIYCAIGQRGTAVARVIADLREHADFERCIVVVAGGEDPPGMQYAAPYAATTMAEYFMQQGRDVLVVYDDLTRHARAYRELSLLLRRPPGREAYPGDIFFIHSRLLERATHLREEKGGGSLTALPVIETEAQNLSAYIPTNLISITDGQIYLNPNLQRRGHLPPIDVGKSVSRVGGKAQLAAYRAVAGKLRLSYAQFEELEAFARFGTRLDRETRRKLDRGARVRAVLKQPQYAPIPVAEQIAVLLAASEGVLDSVAVEKVGEAEKAIRERVTAEMPELCRRMTAGEALRDEGRERLLEVARDALRDAGLTGEAGEEEGSGDADA